ncbi:MAG: hypothetical protein A2X36_12595 [Elusimicrobia bacterium GWA2_69_24]|nr:MAG: hypothetical protein A2X36_12595 [Elusimicrobia bacterium GWA2_69_24]
MRSEELFHPRIDWVLISAILGLLLIGSVAILSAAAPLPAYSQIIQRHFLALAVGGVLFVFGMGFNYQIFQDQSKTLYVVVVAMMLWVLIFGQEDRGTRGWLHFRFFSFQPSELARVGTLLVLANVLDRRAKSAHTLGFVAMALAVVGPVMALIMLEPDFSSTLPFMPMIMGMLFCGGVNIAYLLAMGAYGAITLSLPLVWTLLSLRPELTSSWGVLDLFMRLREFDLPLLLAVGGVFVGFYLIWWLCSQLRLQAPLLPFVAAAFILAAALGSGAALDHQLKGYQRNRFVAFLVPEVDPRGAAYNVQQAQVAIGSGGLWGKGIFEGTQSQLGFIPERHTDFIYAVIGEEMGFWGTMGVLVLYLLLLWRIVNAARLARDGYGYLVCSGVASIGAFHLVVNTGMCLGMVPVAGIPLPLVSYGGSSLVVTLFSLGVVSNVYSKRYAFY